MLRIMQVSSLFACVVLVPLAVAADRTPTPVIVELFTSEGCSSCPAADRLLSRLEQTQPVAGAQVIAIEEHVDYWNQLGWNDPFSSPQYRARQNDYAMAFKASNIYTPQMVVNGLVEFVGSDMDRAYREIGTAAQAETTQIALGTSPNSKDPQLLDLSVHLTNLKAGNKPRAASVYLAITENNLATFVHGGENAGHTVRHSAVVRSFGVIGTADSKLANGGQLVSTLRLPPEWKRENLRAVVFVQERESLHITGASVVDLH
jgi:hypothetical protein